MKPRKWTITDRVQLLFEPADLWVGFFWDRIKRKLYVLPVPCFGLVIQLRAKPEHVPHAACAFTFKCAEPVAKFPHCDPRVLHAPGECKICDEYAPAAQGARMIKGINFTGHTDADKAPCPADAARGLNGAHVWHGNRPKKAE